jgi:hypothetical protein
MRKTGLLITALIVVGAYIAPLGAQSLADVAKKEEERRKQIKTPSKVLTNKDLAEVPPGAVAPPAAGDASADKSATTPADAASPKDKDKAPAKDEAAAGEVKDQKYWSTKMKSLQDALSRDQTLAAAMQTQVNSLTTDFVNRDDPAQRAVIEQNRQTALAELNRLKDQIKKDQKAVDDLQEEARRAGVPAGWLR